MAWLAGIGAWFAAKTIPWKWIGVVLIILAVGGVIAGGYFYVDNLQTKYVRSQADLARQQEQTELAVANANAIKAESDAQVERINGLEQERSQIVGQVNDLRQQIQDMNIEKDIAGADQVKAAAAVAAVNDRSNQLNRLLNEASGTAPVRPRQDRTGKAGASSSPSFIQRALQTLRPKSVHHAD